VLGVLVLVLAIGVGTLFVVGQREWNRDYEVPVTQVVIPEDSAALQRGEHVATALGACIGCHGENLAGAPFIADDGFVTVAAPNLTGGAGGIGASYTDDDWVAAIRHGVGGDGRGLFGMPSNFYTHMSDEDLGALIAYLKHVPPVDNELPQRSAAFLPKMLLAINALKLMPDLITHDRARVKPEEDTSASYGEYLVNIAGCPECHGAHLAGLTDPNGPPPGPNLTPGGELAGWTFEDFQRLIREGTTPTGRPIAEAMPWQAYRHMTDDELTAIWTYLETLPARQLGENE
jgi:mono/diheme cytochrome c family protein